MKNLLITVSLLAGAVVSSCVSGTSKDVRTASGLDPQNFVSVYDGDSTALYTLKNANGMEVCITNFGGRIVSIMVPDKAGKMQDVVLGFDSVQSYFPENNQTDFGAAIGRYANRINQGKFTLDGTEYQLPRNNFGHCLHGGTDMGTKGWQYRVYRMMECNDSTLVLGIESKDGDNGFPGTVKAQVKYTVKSDNSLDITYAATTDKPTIINMTNHSYFNLSGDPNKPITDQQLTINASRYTPVDSTYMTTGEILPVAGTPMDFTNAKLVGAEIEKRDFEQIKNGNGYDHNWVLDTNGDDTKEAVNLFCLATGIRLQVYTNEPGIQVYTGNFLDGTVKGKGGIVYQQRTGICLETQKYPDTPNKPEWPSAVLRPGEMYHSHCIFKFSVQK